MGHALDNTMQDILIRMKRMQGYCTLWLLVPTIASIATGSKLWKMAEEGITKGISAVKAFGAHRSGRSSTGRIVELLKNWAAPVTGNVKDLLWMRAFQEPFLKYLYVSRKRAYIQRRKDY